MASLQIRDVPEGIHEVLKRRAAAAGQSLSEYALSELARSASVPTLQELTERIRSRGRVTVTTPIAEVIGEARRDEEYRR